MAPEVHTPKTAKRIWLGRAGVLSGALLLSPVLIVLISRVAGDGSGSLAAIRRVAVIGPAVDFLWRALVSLYFPHFLAPYPLGRCSPCWDCTCSSQSST